MVSRPSLPIPLCQHLAICDVGASRGGVLEALPEFLQLVLKGIHGKAKVGAAGKFLQGNGSMPPQKLQLVGKLCACVLL